MTEKQEERLEELTSILIDMTGDVMALETFLRCQTLCEERFGKPFAEEWLRRIRDYLKQHLRDTERLTDWLMESTGLLHM